MTLGSMNETAMEGEVVTFIPLSELYPFLNHLYFALLGKIAEQHKNSRLSLVKVPGTFPMDHFAEKI